MRICLQLDPSDIRSQLLLSNVSKSLSVTIRTLGICHAGLSRLMEVCTEFTHHHLKLSHDVVVWGVLLNLSHKIKINASTKAPLGGLQ